MKFFLIIVMLTSMSSNIIFDFNEKSNVKEWVITNDVVMGGKSSSTFGLSPKGHGLFKGAISLDNNGGFCSVKHKLERKLIKNFTTIALRIKGDGKNYQLRIKSNSGDYFSYIIIFSTNGDWQEIQIPLKDMYPSFRGRKLDKPNFSEDYIEEIGFLFGNKTEENFQLMIDKIELK
ncbi:CIA30 family protein [Gaetbulibacter saemankumensis]|uniref:CIA30 family protein n=1 Tax=Gaetbulibacter saemankumensis TaxID=311208 RepID=UPI000405B764|nr:CIA30 family protein [Gaetbulibacter saemankumensis]